MKLTERVRKLIDETCNQATNIYGPTAFLHISRVVEYSKLLAQKLNADEEIVEIAAWLHDYGSITGCYENHHVVGANEAERILKDFNYPLERVEQVRHCIHAHRGSKDIKKETLEAEIVASADAMSHFVNLPLLFYLVYITLNLNYEEGRNYVKRKLERSWKKVMPEGKELIRKKYEAAMRILGNET